MRTIQVIVRTPNTREQAPRFIKKSVKNSATFHPIQDIDPRDTYTRKIEIRWKEFELSPVVPFTNMV